MPSLLPPAFPPSRPRAFHQGPSLVWELREAHCFFAPSGCMWIMDMDMGQDQDQDLPRLRTPTCQIPNPTFACLLINLLSHSAG